MIRRARHPIGHAASHAGAGTGRVGASAGRAVLALLAALGASCSSSTPPASTASATATPPSGGRVSTTSTTAGNAGDRSTTSAASPSTRRPTEPTPRVAALPPGPITVVTIGDSLTEGDGDEDERGGYPGRLEDELDAGGRRGSTVVNLGKSGWDSSQLIEGQEGDATRPQLASALEVVRRAREDGRPVVALVLIGSNDLWYLYGNDAPTTAEEERENLALYEANLDRVVGDLRDAGAEVLVAINDDQSRRPVARDERLRRESYPAISTDEVAAMSQQAFRYAEVVREIAQAHGAVVVDFLEAPFFADPRTLADDGNHPNAAGYDEMTDVWLTALTPLLGS